MSGATAGSRCLNRCPRRGGALSIGWQRFTRTEISIPLSLPRCDWRGRYGSVRTRSAHRYFSLSPRQDPQIGAPDLALSRVPVAYRHAPPAQAHTAGAQLRFASWQRQAIMAARAVGTAHRAGAGVTQNG